MQMSTSMLTSKLCMSYPQAQAQLVLVIHDLSLDTEGPVTCMVTSSNERPATEQ